MLGDEGFPRLVDRWFTRPIAGRTLATFRTLAEAVARLDVPVDESGPAPTTNLLP
jgi:hypothetical protein